MKKASRLCLIVLAMLALTLLFAACNTSNTKNQAEICTHLYSDWQQNETLPRCSLTYKTRSCSLCQDIDYQFTDPAGHTLVNGSVDSYDENGVTAIFKCSECNMLLSETLSLTADTDADGLNNATELAIGTSIFSNDTDSDGLKDAEEVGQTNTNPLLKDSDDDGLDDYAELKKYSTNPLLADTDGDGAWDGKEIELGFDPLAAETSFLVSYTPAFDSTGTSEDVIPSLEVELESEQLNTLVIEKDETFDEDSLGYMGDAYKYDVAGPISSAKIGFSFDSSKLDANALPTIYSYDSQTNTMTPLPTTITNGKATTLVDEFTTYVLLDRNVIESSLSWVDLWDVNKKYSKLEIVFVMDDSGSMTSNDPTNQRLTVARNLIDQLPVDTKIGVVKFASATTALTSSLITDKEIAKNYMTEYYFDSYGTTRMYTAITDSFTLFEATDDETMKMVVVLSDGEADDTGSHNSVINSANYADIRIYTIGLGSSSSSYFNNYLKPLAENTDGKFYLSSNAGELATAFNDIGEKISLTTDADNDGLSDYYEENMIVFSGTQFDLDKNNPDTDGDGLLDGEEIKTFVIYSYNGTDLKMAINGRVYSDPTKIDSDGDGINDKYDPAPFIPATT